MLGILGASDLPLPATEWSADVAALVNEREEARRNKDFTRADELRDSLRIKGFEVEDSPQGTRLYPSAG